MSEGEAGYVAVREDGFHATFGVFRADGSVQFVHPVLAPLFFRQFDLIVLRFVDVGVRVEDARRHPIR